MFLWFQSHFSPAHPPLAEGVTVSSVSDAFESFTYVRVQASFHVPLLGVPCRGFVASQGKGFLVCGAGVSPESSTPRTDYRFPLRDPEYLRGRYLSPSLYGVVRASGWDPYSPHALCSAMFSELDLPCEADSAEPLTTAGEELP